MGAAGRPHPHPRCPPSSTTTPRDTDNQPTPTQAAIRRQEASPQLWGGDGPPKTTCPHFSQQGSTMAATSTAPPKSGSRAPTANPSPGKGEVPAPTRRQSPTGSTAPHPAGAARPPALLGLQVTGLYWGSFPSQLGKGHKDTEVGRWSRFPHHGPGPHRMDGWGAQSRCKCSVSSQCHPKHCPPTEAECPWVQWGVPLSLPRCRDAYWVDKGTRLGAKGRGTSLQGQSGTRDTPGHPPPRFRTCRNGVLLDLQAARGMRSSGRLGGLLPLPSGSHRPLPCPRGGMQQVTPWQPQPLPRAHLTLTFPGAPSMPAGCHSKSKSYKQNQEKSLISIYSNEPCNNANHKSCSHCYSISVSYPSPHTFPGCLASSLLAEAPS